MTETAIKIDFIEEERCFQVYIAGDDAIDDEDAAALYDDHFCYGFPAGSDLGYETKAEAKKDANAYASKLARKFRLPIIRNH